jgi:eukaryotic-like serine/threonine-protein kinase
MGEVYRARDGKLKREVAIKVLPDIFANDDERVARFHREAQLVAALNHPNIAAIYGLEELAARKFLVLELVEGETLAERLQRGRIPLDQALDIAKQIAEALEAAHEKGVVHRDLKPANIKLRPNGTIKVLDFGLAKLADPAGAGLQAGPNISQSPTLTIAGTQVGMILGTAAYMSPEQAKGFNADHRSDIFSFGAVLYEMIAGRQAFDGDSVSDVLASVLKSEPNFSLFPTKLNPRISELARRCLAKNPKARWHAAADVRVEIETIVADPRGLLVEDERLHTSRPLWKRVAALAGVAVLTAAITGMAVWNLRPDVTRPVTQFSLLNDEGTAFTTGQPVTISPDGSQIVYASNLQLYLRSLSELEARPIPGVSTPGGTPRFPVFSPDGRSVVFWSQQDRTLRKIDVTGGASVLLSKDVDFPLGMSWDGDWILFGQRTGIVRVSASGGDLEVLVNLEPGEFASTPRMLPGGRAVLFSLTTSTTIDRWDSAEIVVQTLQTGERKTLVRGGSDARYVPTGHLVYAVGGTLFARPFDLASLEVTGGAVSLVQGVMRPAQTNLGNFTGPGSAYFSFSDTGSLIYVPGPAFASLSLRRTLALIDRAGSAKPLGLPPGTYAFPRISPDGRRVAYAADDGKEANVYLYGLSGQTAPQRLTFGGSNSYPIWSADGQRVAFQSDREGDLGIFWQPVDGGTAELSPSRKRKTSPTFRIPGLLTGKTFPIPRERGMSVASYGYCL